MRSAPLVIAVSLFAGCLDLNQANYVFDAGSDGSVSVCERSCNTPPSPRCLDAKTLESFPAFGACSAQNGCAYTPVRVSCTTGCENGSCISEPCLGRFCDAPQAASCVDASHLRVFEPTGTCNEGDCSYESNVVSCPLGCSNGICAGNTCAGVVCRSAPPPLCVASNTLKVFELTGSCDEGTCRYASRLETCSEQCSNGQCTNAPCTGITCSTPPSNTCLDDRTARTFSPTGACTTGSCVYASTDSTCPASQVCRSGSCVTPSTICAPSSCPDGCCRGDTCVRPGQQTDFECGRGAVTCGGCGSGLECNGGLCFDVNECLTNNGGCSDDATCTNTAGGNTCECDDGYSGDGGTCTEVDAGQWRRDGGACATALCLASCDENGWCSENPDVISLWGSSASNVWAVMEADVDDDIAESFLAHWNGRSWTAESLSQGPYLLYGFAIDDVWAFTPGGGFHFDGATWAYVPGAMVSAVWGTSSRSMWSVSSGASNSWVSSFDGVSWLKVFESSSRFDCIWGSSHSDIWVAGRNGAMAHFNGLSWASVRSSTTQSLASMWGSGPNDIWAVGDSAVIHYDGTEWAPVDIGDLLDTPSDAGTRRERMTAVHGTSATDVWVAASGGVVLHYTGTWSKAVLSAPTALKALWATKQETFAGGKRALFQRKSDRWQATYDSPSKVTAMTYRLVDAWSFGDDGRIGFYDGTRWTTQAGPTTETINAAVAVSSRDVWAVGSNGAIVHWDGGTWSASSVGTETYLAIDVLNAKSIWAVGTGGTIVHYDGTSWSSQDSGVTTTLRSIKDGWVAGDNSTILKLYGSDWYPMAPNPDAGISFTGILKRRSPTEYFFVGSNGVPTARAVMLRTPNGTLWSEMGADAGVPSSSAGGVSVFGKTSTLLSTEELNVSDAWAYAGDPSAMKLLRFNGLLWNETPGPLTSTHTPALQSVLNFMNRGRDLWLWKGAMYHKKL